MFNSRRNMLYNGGGLYPYSGYGLVEKQSLVIPKAVKAVLPAISEEWIQLAINYVYLQDELRMYPKGTDESKTVRRAMRDIRDITSTTDDDKKNFDKVVRVITKLADGSFYQTATRKITKVKKPTPEQYRKWLETPGVSWQDYARDIGLITNEGTKRLGNNRLYYYLNRKNLAADRKQAARLKSLGLLNKRYGRYGGTHPLAIPAKVEYELADLSDAPRGVLPQRRLTDDQYKNLVLLHNPTVNADEMSDG